MLRAAGGQFEQSSSAPRRGDRHANIVLPIQIENREGIVARGKAVAAGQTDADPSFVGRAGTRLIEMHIGHPRAHGVAHEHSFGIPTCGKPLRCGLQTRASFREELGKVVVNSGFFGANGHLNRQRGVTHVVQELAQLACDAIIRMRTHAVSQDDGGTRRVFFCSFC